MSPSEAQKRASNKYNLEHMATLGCKVKKEHAEAFKEYCLKQGKTSNTVLKEFVMNCVDGDMQHDNGADERADTAENGSDEQKKDGED